MLILSVIAATWPAATGALAGADSTIPDGSAPPGGCAADAEPASSSPSASEDPAPGASSESVDALAALYEAAQGEGELMLYTTTPELQTVPQIDAFEAAYPGIDVEFVRLSTNELLQRFAAEAESDVNAADVLSTPDPLFIHGAISGGTMTSLLDAELPGGFPPARYPAEFVQYDGEFGTTTITPTGITYLTTEISGDAIPATFEDVLDPAFQGSIASSDPNQAGSATWDFWDFIAESIGDEFLQQFAAQEPEISLLPVPQAQAQAAGEFALTVPTWGVLTETLKESGAPVEIVVPDLTTGAQTYVGLASAAPHPNAARLFTHFAYSEEGTAVVASNLANQASPYGGEYPLPSCYVIPRTEIANSPERKAELAALLGIPVS